MSIPRPSAPPRDERDEAASLIQKNYRGYRSRREANGLNTDAASRWIEVVREAQYQNVITSRPRSSYVESFQPTPATRTSTASTTSTNSSFAKSQWFKAKEITDRAHQDDTTSDTADDDTMTREQLDEYRRKKAEAKRQRRQLAKDMGLSYWLEMVDEKHRYGSHLRAYHAVWKKADTNENFFQWLDHGEGLRVNTEKCSREVLDRDQVRYLTREQRLQYLVKFDEQGRLRWAKNGERVETSADYIDDGTGIVRRPDADMVTKAPQKENSKFETLKQKLRIQQDEHKDETDSSDSELAGGRPQNGRRKTTVPPAAIFDELTQSTSSGNAKKKPKWIFVADTSFRLYVGMKMSGSFQHSSFLQGARISAAGQIGIKDGLMVRVYPLSGHYRPRIANFRAFIHALRDEGADLSHLILPHSYAVLIGVNSWKKAESHTQSTLGKLENKMQKLFHPGEARMTEEEEEMDGTESARREAEFLARQKEIQEQERRDRVKKRLGILT